MWPIPFNLGSCLRVKGNSLKWHMVRNTNMKLNSCKFHNYSNHTFTRDVNGQAIAWIQAVQSSFRQQETVQKYMEMVILGHFQAFMSALNYIFALHSVSNCSFLMEWVILFMWEILLFWFYARSRKEVFVTYLFGVMWLLNVAKQLEQWHNTWGAGFFTGCSSRHRGPAKVGRGKRGENYSFLRSFHPSPHVSSKDTQWPLIFIIFHFHSPDFQKKRKVKSFTNFKLARLQFVQWHRMPSTPNDPLFKNISHSMPP